MYEVRIWRKEDGLGMKIYNVRKYVLYKSRMSESRGPPPISLSALWIFVTKEIIPVIRLIRLCPQFLQ
jgi:hypothetical protein